MGEGGGFAVNYECLCLCLDVNYQLQLGVDNLYIIQAPLCSACCGAIDSSADFMAIIANNIIIYSARVAISTSVIGL